MSVKHLGSSVRRNFWLTWRTQAPQHLQNSAQIWSWSVHKTLCICLQACRYQDWHCRCWFNASQGRSPWWIWIRGSEIALGLGTRTGSSQRQAHLLSKQQPQQHTDYQSEGKSHWVSPPGRALSTAAVYLAALASSPGLEKMKFKTRVRALMRLVNSSDSCSDCATLC